MRNSVARDMVILVLLASMAVGGLLFWREYFKVLAQFARFYPSRVYKVILPLRPSAPTVTPQQQLPSGGQATPSGQVPPLPSLPLPNF